MARTYAGTGASGVTDARGSGPGTAAVGGGRMCAMRIHIAADHAGFELKSVLVEHLGAGGHDVVDHGALTYDRLDDYPAFCIAAAEAVVAEPGTLGIVIGGSGNGEQIAANKVVGVRAALAWSGTTAELARAHNDANVVAVGARQHSVDGAIDIVEAFLAEPFSGDARHQRRIDQLAAYEAARG
jgi:ribose 5-phosphate isomerase B